MKTKTKLPPSGGFTEYTINLQWSDKRPWEKGYVEGIAEIMVHIDTNGKIIRAYTYKRDTGGMPKAWLSHKVPKNDLFIDLTPTFIADYRSELEEAATTEGA